MADTVLAPPAVQHLCGIGDLSAPAFGALLDLAEVMKRHPLAWRNALETRAVACWFEQRSSRSRVALEVAIHRLGGQAVVLASDELELGAGDSVADTARVLSAYCDAIAVRTHWHRDVLELAEHSSVPVINARSESEYPCRALSACLTLREHFGDLDGLQVAYVGDATTPLTRSLIEAAMLSGVELHVAAPATQLPDPALLSRAGTAVRLCKDAREAVGGSSVVLRGPEAHAEVIDGRLSLAGEQVANLLPVTQAVLRALVTGDWEL
jgi:ornithine carbamoyltransferase